MRINLRRLHHAGYIENSNDEGIVNGFQPAKELNAPLRGEEDILFNIHNVIPVDSHQEVVFTLDEWDE